MGMNGNLRLLRVAALVSIVAAVVGAQAAGVGLAQAALDFVPHARGTVSDSSNRGHTPVTLCHATASQTNPYVVITTDDDGVLGAGHSSGNGHDSHGGDIIPPFDYTDNKGDARSYPGLNWDAAGQAIFADGCEPPPPPCPENLGTTGGGEGDDGDDGCEPPPPCPENLGMTGRGGGDNGDDGCEPPPPCPENLGLTGGGEGDDDECEEEKTKLVVRKVVVNDDGGTATPDDVSFQVNGGSVRSCRRWSSTGTSERSARSRTTTCRTSRSTAA